MNYNEAQRYIEEMSGLGIVPGLDGMRELCRRLGNPQNTLKFVHVAGTNGKGSSSAFIASILQKACYKVGHYSSPAVFEYRERFLVNGRMVSQVAFCNYLDQVRTCADAMAEDGLPHPTVFEMETALAFLFFADKECDVVVLETGMGGRLDATNIVETTLAAVLVSISRDHMAFLGNTLEQIAAEKAGIIKNKCYVISARQEKDAERMIKQKASLEKARYIQADSKRAHQIKYGLKKQQFTYDSMKNVVIQLAGAYQIDNAIVAIETVRALRKTGFNISDEAIYEGLKETQWAGRFEVVAVKPTYIIDGAHNADAAVRLKESIETCLSEEQREHMILIMGVLKDKEYEKVAELICPFGKHVITLAPPNNKRALPAVELAKAVQEVNPSVTVADSPEEAVEIAELLGGKESVILAFGSLSYLGQLKDIILNRKMKKK